MSLPVGIHEGVKLSRVARNDKGTLIVGFKKEETDKIAAISAGRFEPEEQDIMIFPPQITNYGGGNSTAEEMLAKWGDITNPLEHIASQFMTKDKIKWDLFFGTGISTDNYDAKMTNQDTIDKIYNNIVTQFVKWMTPFTSSTKTFRVVFIRTSKAKHYPKLRTKYLTSQPFMEPMEVSPAKVGFSKYEKTNGLDNPTPAGGAMPAPKAEAEEADSLFANTSTTIES